MNTYSKVLIYTLPLVFLLLLSTVGVAYHFSRTALTELAETWLGTRLSEALQIAVGQDDMLHRYGLEDIPASIAKAKMDAGVAMSAIEVGERGFVFAIDRQGLLAVHSDPAMVGRDMSQEPWFPTLQPERSRLIHQTPAGRSLAMVDYFEPWEWYILASDPESEVYGVANRMKPYLLYLGLVGFLAMSVVLMLLTRRLTEPLRLLTVGAEKIGKGDLDTRIAIRSRDEFGRLAQVFNQTAGQLQETLTECQQREEHFRSLIENMSDIIAILDAEGAILYLSPSIERILGYPQDVVMGRRAFDFVHPDDQEQSIQLFNNRIQSATIEPPPPSEMRLQHQDGSWRTLEATSKNLLNDPAVEGLVVNARDVTKRKAAEAALQQSHHLLEDRVAERTAELFKANAQLRQEIQEREQMTREKESLHDQLLQAQKMEAIGTLAGGIAHDFNNLLMGIQGNVEMMALDMGPSHAHSGRLKTIRDCVQSGARLTQQLLGFARMGKYEVKPTDINALVRNSVDMFGRTRQELRIALKCVEKVWAVEVDRGQIEQVLLNLLINAWQAMPDGGSLYLETANEILNDRQVLPHGAEPGNYVKITITDTGTGMDPATMERIFDPFFTTKTVGRGTGLGLASAYGIVRNHGGFMDVSSRKEQGTIFSIHLKATDAPLGDATVIRASAQEGNETILLVDDDPLILDVGQAMLAALGYAVLVAKDGKEAVEIYRSDGDRIRLVILDMIMPDMGGGQTYDQLKEVDPGANVLLSSGYSIDGQATAILNRGCNGFIQKPFDLQSLSEKVRTIMDAAD
ncbi:PAS domain S-box protein [Desulfosarcina sp.]|uniref:PAS domain S-box protein n=1 Tax=Desulfosarcina sp. TaxID=2027861 RepID=UPI0029A24450|nr:PAS domain S-box protein [Desulfosarcina sp.]MDX2454558.1 PAS domain S-box protein [Desulfosarcina sp.]MDX2492193.1 PAS domain S-box protein [Desulfosarcina sp.]